jgi:serine/threonine-protein kinase
MSPEQIEPKSRGVDCTTDVYSLGVTLYEALTLRQPFEGATREALFRDILDVARGSRWRRDSAIGRDLRTVVDTAMARDPAQRYTTAPTKRRPLGCGRGPTSRRLATQSAS